MGLSLFLTENLAKMGAKLGKKLQKPRSENLRGGLVGERHPQFPLIFVSTILFQTTNCMLREAKGMVRNWGSFDQTTAQ